MPPDSAATYLENLPRYIHQTDAYAPGLERIETLMEAMGRPHEAFASVHVAGTNGKGSTASMAAAILTADGRRTGLHLSPHTRHVTERMRVNGTPAPASWLTEAVARYRATFEQEQATFFEATVALTFLYFAEQDVDIAVVEVGLGGRLDATNVLRPELGIITNIGLDHTDVLGDTLADIAREKAGIIKPDVPVLAGATPPEALAVIREVAARRDAPLHVIPDEVDATPIERTITGTSFHATTPSRTYEGLHVSLPGRHQCTNALLALRAAELLGARAEAVHAGLRDVQARTGLRGRFEVLQQEPLIVADVGHNAASLAATLDVLRPEVQRRGGDLQIFLSPARNKDIGAMAALLHAAGAQVTPIPRAYERAMDPHELADLLSSYGIPIGAPRPFNDALEAFQQSAAPADVLLITSSHLLVTQALERFAASSSPTTPSS